MTQRQAAWLAATTETIASHRRMIDGLVAQLSDEELHRRHTADMNSVAILLRHLGGNLQSRWTDFLSTDGEKPSRNRDEEFVDWEGDRASLVAYFDEGWQALTSTIDSLVDSDLEKTVLIRGEPHSVPLAILRAITHIGYHVGQMAMVARTVHVGEWEWLTISPNASREHNEATWGKATSRGIHGGGSSPG